MTATVHPIAGPAGDPVEAAVTDADLVAWVNLWLGRIVERRISNRNRWCPHWSTHPEVVARLRVLCASWLQVTRHGDALALSAWMLDHLDRHLDRLMDADGPFAGCSPDRHNTPRNLAVGP